MTASQQEELRRSFGPSPRARRADHTVHRAPRERAVRLAVLMQSWNAAREFCAEERPYDPQKVVSGPTANRSTSTSEGERMKEAGDPRDLRRTVQLALDLPEMRFVLDECEIHEAW